MWIIFISLVNANSLCEDSENYSIGDSVPVCVVFSNDKTIAFKPTLDKYSAVEVPESYQEIKSESDQENESESDQENEPETHIEVQLKAGGVTSSSLPYIRNGQVAPIMNVVFRVDEGEVTEVIWDTHCDLCDEKCLEFEGEEVCSFKKPSSTIDYKDYKLKVFMSWIGTDSDGFHLTSAGYRMSQFRKYSLYKNYEEARKSFN